MLAHILRFDVGVATPSTIYATLAAVFFGLATGTASARWLPPSRRLLVVMERYPRSAGAAFWIVCAFCGLWAARGSIVSGPWCLGVWFGYGMALTNGRPGEIVRRPKARVVWPLTAAAVLGFAIGGDAAFRALSLDVTDTMADYRTANVVDAQRLRARLCGSGECLDRLDWACGFTNGDEDAFIACFESLADRAPTLRIEHARKICGSQTMRFVDGLHSSPEECQSAGGRWGVQSARSAPTF